MTKKRKLTVPKPDLTSLRNGYFILLKAIDKSKKERIKHQKSRKTNPNQTI